ncbi:GNAT family N-acetyltransferase [Arenibacter latericius]|uniref:GNAT family N-acetyltransferase n=1 Tax=Arenibacter latericius TaxID=86104 RepID=UPI0003FB3365|nr:GNAT family N-acetyltransferase [Arenibacter latericius]MDX1365383.1 GNAT family N-acetyltransferase [Arenibacter latericius]
MALLELKYNYDDFFKMLPHDWQEVICPVWDKYKYVSSIYVLKDGKDIVVGGIVFRTIPPNRTNFEIEIGEEFIAKGFHYIGFLFVHPERRNEALGSRWLDALKTQFPDQGYWLTIEEEALKTFYLKNGFICLTESTDRENPEWIFIYDPVKPIS